jgi:type IV secretion system protein VirD4
MKSEDEFTREKLSRFAEEHPLHPDRPEENREVSSIISTAMTQTGFIGSRAIANNLGASDFRFRDCRRQPVTVYIILPTRHLANCAKWFRLVIAAALADLLIEEEKKVPVLAVLDEFAQLGTLKAVENAMGLAAGYGVQLFCVLQDLNQLKKLYKESFETFVANAGISIWFAPRDVTTSEYVSKLCGVEDRQTHSLSRSEHPLAEKPELALSVNESESWQMRNVLEADQVRKLLGHQFILFAENRPGEHRTCSRRPYWLMPEFAGRAGADPYHVTGKKG